MCRQCQNSSAFPSPAVCAVSRIFTSGDRWWGRAARRQHKRTQVVCRCLAIADRITHLTFSQASSRPPHPTPLLPCSPKQKCMTGAAAVNGRHLPPGLLHQPPADTAHTFPFNFISRTDHLKTSPPMGMMRYSVAFCSLCPSALGP